MGRENRARRAAKARARAKESRAKESRAKESKTRDHGRGRWRDGRGGVHGDPDPADRGTRHAETLLVQAARQWASGGRRSASGVLDRLVALPAGEVRSAAERLVGQTVATLFGGGWQPVELVRQGRLGCTNARGARLVATAVAGFHAGSSPGDLDPRWVAQVQAADLPAVASTGWVRSWAEDDGGDHGELVEAMVDALANLAILPPLEPLLPPPGSDWRSWVSAPGSPDGVAGAEADPLLDRIRALLAKAESTTFEAEAVAFTAKAQELITRHAVDGARLAALAGTQAPGESPVAVRIPVDPPYVDAKSLLLQVVAEAGRCRSVMHGGLSLSSVVGFAADVAAVELLFTSLLVQAQAALATAASRAPAGTRVRSQSYRSAFLVAYANRIGERLAGVNDEVLADEEATGGGAFLPVLVARAEAVDGYVDEHFGRLSSSRVRSGWDAAGWAGGREAADRARLSVGEVGPG